MTKYSTHRLRSTLDALRTQARKMNVEFSEAAVVRVTEYLTEKGVKPCQIDKRGDVSCKTEYGMEIIFERKGF